MGPDLLAICSYTKKQDPANATRPTRKGVTIGVDDFALGTRAFLETRASLEAVLQNLTCDGKARRKSKVERGKRIMMEELKSSTRSSYFSVHEIWTLLCEQFCLLCV